MKTLKHVVLILTVGTFLVASIYGCGTIKGAGKDVGSIGQGMEDASDAVAN
jgi:predicted small secreted protein